MTKEHVNTNHTFAICAYKESPYLEECITSLMEQTVKSEIFIATSTPNKYIDDIAAKYNLKVYVNEGESGITQDWNFAYSKVQTDYVTIAHQDDKYAPEYVENLLAYTAKAKKPLLFFTDYAEIRNGEIVTTNKILKVKRIMLFIMRPKAMWGSRFIRRRVLSLGSPICCPSATYYRPNLMKQVFLNGFRADEDWDSSTSDSAVPASSLHSDRKYPHLYSVQTGDSDQIPAHLHRHRFLRSEGSSKESKLFQHLFLP